MMDRFITYWKHYGWDFGEELLGCLHSFAKIDRYTKGDVVYSPANPSRHCYFVLSGELQVEKLISENRLRTIDFVLPYQSFTGTVHLHTTRYSDRSYTCIKPSEILRIDNSSLIQLAQEHPSINDILHILKQRMITRQERHIELLQQQTKYQQFVFLQEEMGDLCQNIPIQLLADFLGIARNTYFNYKKRWRLGD